MMEWLGLDVFALLLGCPELDGSWRIVNVLAHTYDIVEEMLAVKLRVILERYIQRFHGNNSVQSQVIQYQIFLDRAKEEPSVPVFLQKVWIEDILTRLLGIERLIHDSQRLLGGDVIVEWIQQLQALEVWYGVEVDDGLSVALADGQVIM